MIDMYSRASAEQIKAYEDKKQAMRNNTEELISYMDENGQIVTIKGRENIEEYYRNKGIDTNSAMSIEEQEMLKQQEELQKELEKQQTQRNNPNQ